MDYIGQSELSDYVNYIYCLEGQLKQQQEENQDIKNDINEFIRELGTMKWIGADEGWDLAINKVQQELIKRFIKG